MPEPDVKTETEELRLSGAELPAKQINNSRNKLLIVIALVVILGAATYTAYRVFGDASSVGLFSNKTTPLTVLPKLGTDKTNVVIGAKGGEIKLADDTTVLFPAKSVPGSKEIGATELESVQGLPAAYQIISGIELTPATSLTAAAIITLPLPAGTDTTNLVGFEYDDNGKDFHFVPISVVGQSVIMNIHGFSGHGVLSVGDSSQLPPNPSSIEKQANQFIANITRGKSELSDDNKSKIQNILTGWFNASVSPSLEKAAGANDSTVDDAVHEFLKWQSVVQLFGYENQLEDLQNIGDGLAGNALKMASENAYKSCVDNQDPFAAAKLFRWYMLSEYMNLDGKSGLSVQKIQADAQKCLNFKLVITSAFDGDEGEKTVANGIVNLTFNDDFTISGEGQIEQTAYSYNSTNPCKSSTPIIFPVKVPGVAFDPFAKTPGVSLYFELGEPLNGRSSLDCSTEELGFTFQGLQPWREFFYFAHEAERIGESNYMINDFEITGSGSSYAKKVYTGTTNDQKENTTLELIHIPK